MLSANQRQKHRVKRNAYCRGWKERHFFYDRARKFNERYGHIQANVTALDLWSLWKKQRGRCALTGRRLNGRQRRGAAVDHILARKNGGQTVKENLRWLCCEANRAKDVLSDDQLVSLCRDIFLYSGRETRPGLVGSPC